MGAPAHAPPTEPNPYDERTHASIEYERIIMIVNVQSSNCNANLDCPIIFLSSA